LKTLHLLHLHLHLRHKSTGWRHGVPVGDEHVPGRRRRAAGEEGRRQGPPRPRHRPRAHPQGKYFLVYFFCIFFCIFSLPHSLFHTIFFSSPLSLPPLSLFFSGDSAALWSQYFGSLVHRFGWSYIATLHYARERGVISPYTYASKSVRFRPTPRVCEHVLSPCMSIECVTLSRGEGLLRPPRRPGPPQAQHGGELYSLNPD
jgi:hypothetical protein